jgi:putative FmdB family regulatory protein
MPLYTYSCSQHGEFAAWNPMERSEAPQPCPTCAQQAPRALAHPAVAGRSGSGDGDFGGDGGMDAGGMGGDDMGMGGGCGCGAGHCMH